VPYNVPTRNINETATFFFQCNWRLTSCDIGRASIQPSRAILITALDQPRPFTFKQDP